MRQKPWLDSSNSEMPAVSLFSNQITKMKKIAIAKKPRNRSVNGANPGNNCGCIAHKMFRIKKDERAGNHPPTALRTPSGLSSWRPPILFREH
uniref:Uncharacterized protein n=1 Tax=Steinernema glaseri TaxID=37863 RepID=A0A1I8A633_9BILA